MKEKSIIKTEHGYYYRITDVEGAVGASISILGQIRLSPGKYSPVANMIVSNYVIPPISKSTTLAVVDEYGDSHDCVARFDNDGVFTAIGLPKERLIVGGFVGGIRIDEHGWRDLNSEIALEEFVRCATFGQEDPNNVLARLAKKAKMKPAGSVLTK